MPDSVVGVRYGELDRAAEFSRLGKIWAEQGLSILPADRRNAEAMVQKIYQAAGLNLPEKIVWSGSPLSQGLARAVVLDDGFLDIVTECAWDAAKNSSGTQFSDDVVDSFRGSMRLFDTAAVKRNLFEAIKSSVAYKMRVRISGKMKPHMRSAAVKSVWQQVWQSVWAVVEEPVWKGIENGIKRSIEMSSKRGLDESVAGCLKHSIGECVKWRVWGEVMDKAWGNVRNGIHSQIRVRAWDELWSRLQGPLWESVAAPVSECIKASGNDSAQASCYGQHDAYWLSFYAYFREVEGLMAETEQIAGLLDMAKYAGWFVPHEKVCWICERPSSILLDANGKLHAEDGPALVYPDGWSLYARAGVLRFEESQP